MPSKVYAITHHPKPHSVRVLHELLGIINFEHRFIPNAATTLRPLYCAPKGKLQNQCLVWSNDMTNAYTSSINSLVSATLLAHPRSDVPIAVTSDAADSGFEHYLNSLSKVHGNLWPFSKQLREPERKYNTFDRELLALFLAIRHFRVFTRRTCVHCFHRS